MMDSPIIPCTWNLPEGHESVAAFATAMEALDHGQQLVRDGAPGKFYITDRRGAYELIRHQVSTPDSPTERT